MTALYVSNPTKQTIVRNYRMPHDDPHQRHLRRLEIRSGQQDVIHGERPVIRHIIDQLLACGDRDGAESHGKMEGFKGLIFREEGQISTEEIQLAHEGVVETENKIAVAEATKSALGFDNALRHEQKRKRGRPAKLTQIEVEQETPRDGHKTGNEVHLDITVDPEGRADERLPT